MGQEQEGDRSVVTRFLQKWGKGIQDSSEPAVLCGMEMVPLTKSQEAELVVIKINILLFSLGILGLNKQELVHLEVQCKYKYCSSVWEQNKKVKPSWSVQVRKNKQCFI